MREPRRNPPVFVSTGFVPLAAVDAASGFEPLDVVLSFEDEVPSPRFAKAIAAMRSTTTATTVTRLLEEDDLVPRRAPP